MSISTKFVGQIGNNLCQFVIGKLLADKTGLQYRAPRYFVDKRRRPVTWSQSPLLVPEGAAGRVATGRPQDIYANHWIDLDGIDPDRPVNIHYGYFQRYELMKPYKERIRTEWLKLRTSFLDTDDDAVYVHVRRTDYVNRPPHMGHSIDEYGSCLNEFPDAKRIVVVTDGPNDPFISEFGRFGKPWEINLKPWDVDWLTLMSCRSMVMSQSTFSWWAAFLGRAEKIVCPMFPGTFWHSGMESHGITGQEFPNLCVDDEPDRWIWKTDDLT